MQRKRKLWATKYAHAGAEMKRHESQAATYRWVAEQARRWAGGAFRSQRLSVLVDERDGRGFRTYELIDLDELAKSGGAS